MQALANAGTLVCLVLFIFAGVAIPLAWRLDRQDRQEASKKSKSEGTN